ncbi:L-sorbose 1-dehydrogenase-like [Mytilus trossulus]|uniref:L-sorbose 1-dehydrogenase-like n=1 Tax=Mytilus trossulus TaxID=6551 RepID=UPI003003AFC8
MSKTELHFGGGTSGAVLASRLSEGPDSVLLVEAGRSDLENENVPVPAYAANIQLTQDDWNYYSVPQQRTGLAMNDRREYWPRGKILGGCSSTGYSTHHRGSVIDYNEWAAEGATGWSYRDVLPYFLKSEDMQIPALTQSPFHSTGGPLTITTGASTPVHNFFQAASSELAYQTIDCNGPDSIGFCPLQNNIRDGERCSSVSCFLRRVIGRPNLQVSVNTLGSKIIIRDGRAVGVEVLKNGRRLQLFANKEVILSAGIINTPQILMLSGIGPAPHLSRFGIPVESDLPVGNNLQDQLTILMHYTIDANITYSSDKLSSPANMAEWLVSKTGVLSRAGADGTLFARTGPSPSLPLNYPDIWIFGLSYASDEATVENGFKFNFRPDVIRNQVQNADSSGFNLFPLLIRPESRGTIRLASTNPRAEPLIIPNHLATSNDVDTLIRGIRLVQRLVSTQSFGRIMPRFVRRDFGGVCQQQFDSDEYWRCMLHHFSHHIYHACCTNRMGNINDPTAVVDPELRVKGIQNLRVVDASVMRNQIAGDPHAPAIMIAEKAADMIRGINTVGRWRQQVDMAISGGISPLGRRQVEMATKGRSSKLNRQY